MPRTRSDISNSAIRIFLQNVGKFYDKARGFNPFVPNTVQKDEILAFFGNDCCYCGTKISRKSISLDHLVPMNKACLGLHAWGNVVPCCRDCNNEKQQSDWEKFLTLKADQIMSKSRQAKIKEFVSSMKYDPNLDLHEYAGNLYEDVGEVSMTLINLRYKQAEEGIKKLLSPNS